MIFTTMEQDPPVTPYEIIGDYKHGIPSHEAAVGATATTTLNEHLFSESVIKEVAKLHDLPLFLRSSQPELFQKNLIGIVKIVGLIALIHVIILQLFKRHRAHEFDKKKQQKKESSSSANDNNNDDGKDVDANFENHRGSYQMTNLIINFMLGCVGIYQHALLPSLTVAQRVSYPGHTIFACAQIAYQIWALPVGLLLVNESKSMLIHHVSVIFVAALTGFTTCGFRYHASFFYGVIEISSVPLAVMNMFKNHPEWVEAMPSQFTAIKITFAVAFLTTRVVMWIPRMVDFLYLLVVDMWTCQSRLRLLFDVINFSSALTLTFLQMLWATKIVRGLGKIIIGPKKLKTMTNGEHAAASKKHM